MSASLMDGARERFSGVINVPVCGIRFDWLKLYKTQLTGVIRLRAVELCENPVAATTP